MPPKEENYPDILELMRQAAAKRADEVPGGHRAPGLWRTLEAFAESHPPAAVLASWRHYAGEEYGTVGNFLRATARSAQWYPCLSAAGCGNPHDVVALDDGRWLARSQEDQRYCPAIWLTEPELAIYELDVERLGVELCRVLGFETAAASGASEAAPKLWPVGTHLATRSPVYLALCPNEGQLLLNLQCLFSVCREPFILLAPTARYRSELIGTMLHRERCGFIPLTSCLSPEGSGFRLIAPVAPVLDRFAAGLADRGNSESSKRKVESGKRPASGSHGRLQWANDFKEVRLGGVLYNLQTRKKARYCIQYLVQKGAFDEKSARHLEREIDPYVRKHSKMPPLLDSSRNNLRIQHYFTGTGKNVHQLCAELIKSAGNGRFYLHTQ